MRTGGARRGCRAVCAAVVSAPLAYALLTVVTVATMLWGWGFLAIYRRPLTRVTASRWIYENVPEGSVVANEHWDDPLPFSIDGKIGFKPSGGYYGLTQANGGSDGQMEKYGEDTPEKREAALPWLNEADYLVLSRNRLWGSIPRLPMRLPDDHRVLPAAVRGQAGLRAGGATSPRSRPSSASSSTTRAPKRRSASTITRRCASSSKTPEYSEALVRSYFDQIDLENTIQMWPKQVSEAPTALLLTPEEDAAPAGRRHLVRDLRPDDSLVNRSPVVSVLVWLLWC